MERLVKAKYGTTEALLKAWAISNEPLGEELIENFVIPAYIGMTVSEQL